MIFTKDSSQSTCNEPITVYEQLIYTVPRMHQCGGLNTTANRTKPIFGGHDFEKQGQVKQDPCQPSPLF